MATKVINLDFQSFQSVSCIQKAKDSSFHTDEICNNRFVRHHNLSFLATKVASDEKQTILEKRIEFKYMAIEVLLQRRGFYNELWNPPLSYKVKLFTRKDKVKNEFKRVHDSRC